MIKPGRLLLAATHLRRSAAELRESHMVRDRWDDDRIAKQDHDQMVALADELEDEFKSLPRQPHA